MFVDSLLTSGRAGQRDAMDLDDAASCVDVEFRQEPVSHDSRVTVETCGEIPPRILSSVMEHVSSSCLLLYIIVAIS